MREYPTAPKYSYLNVTAHTTGGDPDINGYKAVVDGEERVLLWLSTPVSVRVEPGTHSVSLNDVAGNCTISGAPTRSVTVGEGEGVAVTFDLACVATGLTVTTSTKGSDTPDSLQVLLSGQPPYRMAKTGRLDIGRLAPGSYTVGLVVTQNCTVSGGSLGSVLVVASTVAAVPAFEIDCAPAVRAPRVAFVNTDTLNGTTHRWIETVKLDGSARDLVVPGDAPAWSPDGTRLIFSTKACMQVSPWEDYGDSCDGGLALIDPETRNRSIPSAAAAGFRPAWAPTGDAIAFERRRLIDGPVWLEVMRTADSSAAQLQVQGPGPSSLEQPAWSPDGLRLAFACTELAKVDLCLVNRDGSGLVRLTDDALVDSDPAWSPDGTRIAFTRRGADPSNPTSRDVALFDLRTSAITLLTKGSDPAWAPNGSQMAFAGSDGIFIVNADGTSRVRLTSGSHGAPAWRP